ncbi:MAG: spermidine synthase [Lachnospiraceae bacterium]
MEVRLLRNKPFLYITEFFAGMSVMAVELGASRLLAPYFSSSQIVWTVIIGVIMIALAIGNVWGGRLADKKHNPEGLYLRILVAAVWIALIPFLGRYMIVGISLLLAVFVNHNILVWAALLTCLVIFAFPCVLFGTVTPSLIKFSVKDLDKNGKTVGELGALNTIGSILGTFLPTFITIPAFGTAATFLIFSAVLAVIAIVYFISAGRRSIVCLVAVVLLLVLAIRSPKVSFAFWQDDLTKEEESIYNYLQVKESDTEITLSTNVLFGVQSVKMKEDELTGLYYDYALAAPVMAGVTTKTDNEILVLGLGSGTFADYCLKYFEDIVIEGVEIDKKIVDLAYEYFDLDKSVQVTVGDARAYLTASEKKYDVIMVDAYQDITIPFQMSTIEFFAQVKQHLKDTGVMVVNLNLQSEGKDSINEYLCNTIGTVFPYVYAADVKGINSEVFATSSASALQSLKTNRTQLDNEALVALLETVADQLEPVEAGDNILTDDKAPVELLGMKALDEVIADELEYYRGIYLGDADK